MLKDINIKQQVNTVRSDLKHACQAMRDEFDMHLDTINQNTDEIQQNYEYLAQIENKIDKLVERMDAIEMSMARSSGKLPANKINLTHREQEIFIVLYSSPDRITRKMISQRLGFTEDMVDAYLGNIIAKGVPVLKQIVDGNTHFFLDHDFRQMQAKQKIIPISETIVREIFHTNQ
ncbi:MAG: hypothetical protein KKG59_07550 [Nanoarchaeota archaeon]|nr:hypothetical protein [Nanoarchaeota archaeon]